MTRTVALAAAVFTSLCALAVPAALFFVELSRGMLRAYTTLSCLLVCMSMLCLVYSTRTTRKRGRHDDEP